MKWYLYDKAKSIIEYDAYWYISAAINDMNIDALDELINSEPPIGYKGTEDLIKAATKIENGSSLLDLAFNTKNKEIIKKILVNECADLHLVNQGHYNALANNTIARKAKR